jgi:polysaccharide export outer membrane protein
MIRMHLNPSVPCLTHAGLLARLLSVIALLFLVGSTGAIAQFSGPATSSASTFNQSLTITTDPAILYPGQRDVVLTNGDMVSIRLFADAEYVTSVRINNDGTVLLPLIGIVHLEGLSVTKAEQLIAEKLIADGMYRNPQVTLQITEGPNSVVTIVGEAHAVVPIVGSRRLLDVISTAGGLPPTASHVITIDRPGVSQPIVIDLGTDPLRSSLGNIPVFPGDTIVVSRIGIVYIFGSFKSNAGTIPLNAYTPLTLVEATALSGGVTFDANSSDLRIIRTVGTHRTVAVYNIKKVLNGKVPDPILQPNDIVYLPPVPLKQLVSSGGLGTVLSIASLALTFVFFFR